MRQVVTAGFLLLVAGALVAGFLTRASWMQDSPERQRANSAPDETKFAQGDEKEVLSLSRQALRNLSLRLEKPSLRSYWQMLQIPGAIVDRPGHSDRGVTAPAMGVVAKIHAYPGDTVRPNDPLYTIRLISEYLQGTQKDLFSATREIALLNAQADRLRPLASQGGVPQSQVIEIENQLERQTALIQAHRQDLLTRGLSPEQINSVTRGEFVSTVLVVAPPLVNATHFSSGNSIRSVSLLKGAPASTTLSPDLQEYIYEVQELNAELGQQVQAGQLLTTLANHSSLYIEGYAFKREAPMLERVAQEGWPLEVEFAEDDPEHWPPLEQEFTIRHLANAIDPQVRTFDFFVSLRNQSRSYEKGGETFMVWRFRPGQRVRLRVPVSKFDGVFVLPLQAVAKDGPESYVFRQSGGLFTRIPVNILHQDRLNVVVANDGSIEQDFYLAQGSAAALNRAFKSQSASGVQPNVHVHADGTVHANH